MAEYPYPLPLPDQESEGFWEGAKQHELRVQRCSSCQAFRHPPRRHCPSCHSEESEWVRTNGRGRIYGWVEIFQSVLPAWAEDVPYNVVEVELDDAPGVVVTGNVADVGEDGVTVGMPVEVIFDDVSEEISIPRWRLL